MMLKYVACVWMVGSSAGPGHEGWAAGSDQRWSWWVWDRAFDGLRSKRGPLVCFFAETVGWRAPASVGDEVGGFKGWVAARWSLMEEDAVRAKLRLSLVVSWRRGREHGRGRGGEEERRARLRKQEASTHD